MAICHAQTAKNKKVNENQRICQGFLLNYCFFTTSVNLFCSYAASRNHKSQQAHGGKKVII